MQQNDRRATPICVPSGYDAQVDLFVSLGKRCDTRSFAYPRLTRSTKARVVYRGARRRRRQRGARRSQSPAEAARPRRSAQGQIGRFRFRTFAARGFFRPRQPRGIKEHRHGRAVRPRVVRRERARDFNLFAIFHRSRPRRRLGRTRGPPVSRAPSRSRPLLGRCARGRRTRRARFSARARRDSGAEFERLERGEPHARLGGFCRRGHGEQRRPGLTLAQVDAVLRDKLLHGHALLVERQEELERRLCLFRVIRDQQS